MHFTIIDCYTDEPSGLGVPPYLGTYPRYLAGAIKKLNHDYHYLTIDDLRLTYHYNKKAIHQPRTNIKIRNLSKNYENTEKILDKTDILLVNGGVQTPGKYLAALPGTIKEVTSLLLHTNKKKILTGPTASAGEGLYGGRKATKDFSGFDLAVPELEYKLPLLIENNFTENVWVDNSFKNIRDISILGAEIVQYHPGYPDYMIVDIETSRGCSSAKCSFCTEPIKNKFINRTVQDIVDEIKSLSSFKIKNFRLGKQADFFARPAQQMEQMLKSIVEQVNPNVLHIDNVNPQLVDEEKTKLTVQYCTAGNVAAFGVETFDPIVHKDNTLNSDNETTMKAVRIMNKYGKVRGSNGMPKLLPGINILFGLKNETKKTHEWNMQMLKQILDEDLWIRRINIRQAVVFEGTKLEEECGDKFVKKNKKYYWKWRNQIRQEIDYPMLQRVIPKGTILTDVITEIHDGNTTFGRQIGTYPIVIGIKQKLPLGKVINVRVTDHMLRSITAEVV